MSYTYLLAGEDLELAAAELQGFLRSQQIKEEPEIKGRLGITESEPSQLKRLALVHEVTQIKQRAGREDFNPDYIPEGLFKVRVENLTEEEIDKKELEAEYGREMVSDSNEVDLENPDETVKIYILEDEIVLGVIEQDIERALFDKRKNQDRPFSSPVSLDPVLARVMMNLSEVKPGEHLLDPFCGTGGILIEAGLCGVGVHGLDISEEMVEGTRENLEEYGVIVHDIKKGSIEDLSDHFPEEFDAVVTDLPYGKASKEVEEPVEEFLQKIKNRSDGKTVFMYNEPDLGGYEHDFEVYVHKNLTRYIYIL